MAGFYSYVNGTGFDALNSMGFNFIIDVFSVNAGTYTVSYPQYPSMTIQLTPVNTLTGTGSRTFTYSQSGNSVTYTTSVATQIVVSGNPVAGATMPYTGFQLYKDDGTVLIAPTFTPLCLCQVIDTTPSNGQVIQTIVPAGRKILAFHRATTQDMDQVLWNRTTQNGYEALSVISANYSSANGAIPIRIYVFSDILPANPTGGFYMYNNGVMVWHSNCLPLLMYQISDANPVVPSGTNPKAILSSVGSNRNIISGSTSQYRQQYTASSAGFNGSQWSAGRSGYLYINNTVSGNAPAGWENPYGGVIDTAIYDAYYTQSLGY